MNFEVKFEINEKIYLKNPENSLIGKLMVKSSIDLIYELGFEQFTFKKLANHINCTEATIYRYFENKHRILLYILNWYWSYMEFLINFKLEFIKSKREKIKIIIDLFTSELDHSNSTFEYNKNYICKIVISESSKAYLIKNVAIINKEEVFKPYKNLCTKIATTFSDYNPNYKYPRSLSTTLIESVHQQEFFGENLPKLTDICNDNKSNFTNQFIENFIFKILD
jgi:Bacterial regulatory proteins, tetR family